jgi:hypothetical protein
MDWLLLLCGWAEAGPLAANVSRAVIEATMRGNLGIVASLSLDQSVVQNEGCYFFPTTENLAKT